MIAAAFVLAALGSQEPAAATLQPSPAEAMIGEPITWTLALDHDSARSVRGPGGMALVELAKESFDDSWVMLEEPRLRRRAAADHTRTEVRWTVLSLEPRTDWRPGLDVDPDLASGPGSGRGFELELDDGEPVLLDAGAVTVAGELAPDEDAPRAMPGFHEVQGRPTSASLGAGVALLALLVIGGGWWFTRRRRVVARPVEPSALERLGALTDVDATDSEGARTLMFELSALVRSGVERSLDEPRPGLSDEEWLSEVRGAGRFRADVVEELEALLGTCAAVKYGGQQPTRFAVDDALERAKRLLESLPEPSTQPVAAASRTDDEDDVSVAFAEGGDER